ncbi:MAG TPA: prolyl oligopeptidase family serine peptidase [Anaerolineaceae bacterium]
MTYRIESLLSARTFAVPQRVDDRLFFISNLSGHLSLYAMNYGGSVPEPLLPPHIALQNPHLIDGVSFKVFPKLGKILVMIDRDGDENYQPMLINMDGGFPEPAFGEAFARSRVHVTECDIENDMVYLGAESRDEALMTAYRCNLRSGELVTLDANQWGPFPVAFSADHQQAALLEGYSMGDTILKVWKQGQSQARVVYGTPIEQRQPGTDEPLTGFGATAFTQDGCGLLVATSLFTDTYGLGYLDFERLNEVQPVTIEGVVHQGAGELVNFGHLDDDRYSLEYNIDGASWLYAGVYDAAERVMRLQSVVCGQGQLAGGVLQGSLYDAQTKSFALSFTTASTPTQIYTVDGEHFDRVVKHTNERILGIQDGLLSDGEDASFVSFDGLRTSARLYLPAEELGFTGPRPVVFYIHGGPQGQERPDFSWFSMPLIQFLTLNGIAVYVPNVRGSTGYGLSYTKHVDHDWGGQDRLDHIHAFSVLEQDPRLDVTRAGVVGRSYGGYMTLTLAGRHPEKWSAAVDMFGPYNLLTFFDRIPETWKPYFRIALGDPATEEGKAFLVERSPNTYIDQIQSPLLVIQGRNDPRVVAKESEELVDHLREQGKKVDLIIFENEGHDVLKYENRVRCYTAITDFFRENLKP